LTTGQSATQESKQIHLEILHSEAKIAGDQVDASFLHLMECQCVDFYTILKSEVGPMSDSASLLIARFFLVSGHTLE